MIWFVGAGPGAEDLITVRGQRLLMEADLVIYAGSLVNPALLQYCKEDCEVRNSAYMTLEQVIEAMTEAERAGKKVVRLHTGDPSLYGAIREQMDLLDEAGIKYQVCPGVSSFSGAAAALQAEYTLPDVSQSVVITRMAGRTPVPEKESVRSFAAHGATMVLFLSTGLLAQLQEELLAGGYTKDTPASIVYKATWPEEKVFRCTVGTLKETADQNQITRTALIVVGNVLDSDYRRSDLYHPGFSTGYRSAHAEQKVSEKKMVYVVGMGPGKHSGMTFEAAEIIERCPVIAGYHVYTELLKKEYPGKMYLTTPMRQETERCRLAFEAAQNGKDVAMVCSGDAGVYGMAGLMYQIGKDYPDVEIQIVPGVTAALAGGAVLGAPLMHDFAVISLSDLLTDWEKIEKRLLLAAKADLVICLYNPSSRKRADYLKKACDQMLQYKKPETICGIVRNIGRDGEESEIMTLAELRNKKVDMFTTVYIGNEQTMVIDGKMVTPRGYQNV